MSVSEDSQEFTLIRALGGGMFFHDIMKQNIPPDGWAQGRIMAMFACGGHSPLYFLSKMPRTIDFLPPALSQCILGFGGGMFFFMISWNKTSLSWKKTLLGICRYPHPEPRRQRNHQQTMISPPGSEFELILAGRPQCFFHDIMKKRFQLPTWFVVRAQKYRFRGIPRILY